MELREVVGEIMMEKVSFQYAEGGEEVLGSISLHVRPGETVAVVGPSGSGKSSILKLLLRLYDPTAGEFLLRLSIASPALSSLWRAGSIMVDGVDIREVSLSSLRKHMAIVPQDCVRSMNFALLYGHPLNPVISLRPYSQGQLWRILLMAFFLRKLIWLQLGNQQGRQMPWILLRCCLKAFSQVWEKEEWH